MRFKVRYAKLHTAYFSNGTGNLGDVLDPTEKHKGMELHYTEQGLFASYKGVHFVVSLSNIVGVTFYSDPFPEFKEKAPAAVAPAADPASQSQTSVIAQLEAQRAAAQAPGPRITPKAS